MDYSALCGRGKEEILGIFEEVEACSEAMYTINNSLNSRTPLVVRRNCWLYSFIKEVFKGRAISSRGFILRGFEIEKVKKELQGYIDYLVKKYSEFDGESLNL